MPRTSSAVSSRSSAKLRSIRNNGMGSTLLAVRLGPDQVRNAVTRSRAGLAHEGGIGDVEAGQGLAQLDAVLGCEQQVLAGGLDVAQRPQQRAAGVGGGAPAQLVGDRRDLDADVA